MTSVNNGHRADAHDLDHAAQLVLEHAVTLSHWRDDARRRGDKATALHLTWTWADALDLAGRLRTAALHTHDHGQQLQLTLLAA